MKKNVIKFGAGIFGLVIIGGAVWYGVLSYQRKNSPEYAMTQEYEKLSEAYKNDTYGGATPEETLRLFIDALKAGDTDLAAKYFVVDKQAEWKEKLGKLKLANSLNLMIDDLSGEKSYYDINETRRVFDVLNNKREVIASVDIARGPNGKWKIIDL